MSIAPPISDANERIAAWKGIASYFGRDERTVKRWERERGLPIRRMPGERGGVFAYKVELDQWLNSAKKPRESAVLTELAASPKLSQPLSPLLAATIPASAAQTAADTSAPVTARRLAPAKLVNLGLGAVAAAIFLIYMASVTLAAVRSHTSHPVVAEPRPEAKEAYLMGRYYWNRRTDGSLKQAVDAFTQAVVHDPGYARAYAGLAESYDLMPEYSTMPNAEAFPRAIAAAQKAIELDSSLAEAHRALAFGEFYWQWKIDASLAEYRRAIALDPHDVEGHHWYATALLTLGRLPEAQAEIERARELDPASRSILSDQALIGYSAGHVAENVEKLRGIERAEPDFVAAPRYLARIFFEREDFPAFLLQSERAANISGDPQEKAVAEAAAQGWAARGRTAMLEAMRTVQKQQLDQGQDMGYEFAQTSAMLGDKAAAVVGLEAAFRAHDYMLMTIFTGDFQQRLGGYPPFEALKARVRARMSSTA